MHETDTEAQFNYEPIRGLKPVEPIGEAQLLERLDYLTDTLEALLVVSLRSYDATMSLLEHFNQAEAQELHEKHKNGEVFGPPILIPRSDDLGVDPQEQNDTE